eukprot:1786787-Rhodomonas_salina.1
MMVRRNRRRLRLSQPHANSGQSGGTKARTECSVTQYSTNVGQETDFDTTECYTVPGFDANQHAETLSNADPTGSTAHGLNNVLSPHQRSFPQPDT